MSYEKSFCRALTKRSSQQIRISEKPHFQALTKNESADSLCVYNTQTSKTFTGQDPMLCRGGESDVRCIWVG